MDTKEAIFELSGRFLRLKLGQECVEGIDPNFLNIWLSNLDQVYIACCELVGRLPYNGQIITIESAIISAHHFAHAGFPIKLNKDYVNKTLQDFYKIGDWSFGVLHEIGHEFAPHIGFHLNNFWNWEEEMFANFRMYYAIEKLNATVFNGRLYTGKELESFFETDCNDSYLKTIAAKNYVHHDAIMYTLLRIKNKVGWEPFKLTFFDLYSRNEYFETKKDKFNLFLDELSRFSGENVRSTFPNGELEFIEDALNKL